MSVHLSRNCRVRFRMSQRIISANCLHICAVLCVAAHLQLFDPQYVCFMSVGIADCNSKWISESYLRIVCEFVWCCVLQYTATIWPAVCLRFAGNIADSIREWNLRIVCEFVLCCVLQHTATIWPAVCLQFAGNKADWICGWYLRIVADCSQTQMHTTLFAHHAICSRITCTNS